jgi:2'-phosphotransferase
MSEKKVTKAPESANVKGPATTCNKRRNKRQMNPEEELSRSLSWALRHAAPQLKLDMCDEGYVPVSQLLANKHPKFASKHYTVADVNKVVEENEKQRFHLEYRTHTVASSSSSGGDKVLCIRASQGHSIKMVRAEKLLTPLSTAILRGELLSDNIVVIHGTTLVAWDCFIKTQGLHRMKRNHIHFAKGLPGDSGVISGMRKHCEVHIYIETKACANDAIPFYESANGVILTAGVDESGVLPLEYFSKVVNARTGKVLFQSTRES